MPIRANISRVYLARLGIVALFCLVWTALSLKDGLYSYPAEQKYAQALEELEEAHKEQEDLSGADRRAEKEALAEEHGWPPLDKARPDHHSDGDIKVQFAMAVCIGPIGLVFLYFILRNWGRWIEATEKGLTSSRGDDFTFDQIVEFNKRQWKKKGIARIFYDDDGRRRKLVLDDCNYERQPTVQILRLVEEHISHDLITQGTPEPPPQSEDEFQDAPEEEGVDQGVENESQ